VAARLHRVAVDLGLDVDALGGVGLEPRDVDLCARRRRRRRRVRHGGEGEGGGACRKVSTSSGKCERRPGERAETAEQDEAQSSPPPSPPLLAPQHDV